MSAELDLLIRAALLANLPRSGSVWPEKERQEWLRFAETLFKLVFEDGDRSEDSPQQARRTLAVGPPLRARLIRRRNDVKKSALWRSGRSADGDAEEH
jgi:hypothetical protein